MIRTIEESIRLLSDAEGLKNVCRRQEESHPMPSTDVINKMIKQLRAVLFPGYFGDANVKPETVNEHIERNINEIQIDLLAEVKSGICFENSELDFHCAELNKDAESIVQTFIATLPELRDILYSDVVATFNGDPSSKSIGEVIFSYPGIRAISSYRIAHALLQLKVPIIPRVITELAHSETGIDIHPGATIGNSFMIDHGTGVVIGETARIGNNVRIYQGVTMGAKSFPLDENGNPIKGIDRHPKLEDNVVVYSNSTILGPITVGKGAIIGGNIWVDKDVPAGTRILQKKQKKNNDEKEQCTKDKKHNSMPQLRKCKECKSKKKWL